MKTTLVLLLLVPIVAFAATLPRPAEPQSAPGNETHDDESLFDKIREKLSEIRGEIKEKIGEAKDEVKHELETAKDKLEKVESEIKDEASKLKEKVQEKVSQVEKTAEDKVNQLKNSIHDALEKIKEEIKEKIAQAKKDLDNLKDQAKTKVEDLKAKAKEIVDKVKYQLIEKLAMARSQVQKLEEQIGGEVAQAQEKYGELKNETKTALENVKREAQQKLQEAKEKLSQAEAQLKQKLQEAQQEFNHLKEEAKEKYSEAVDQLKKKLSEAEDVLKQKVQQAQEEVKKIKDQVQDEIQKIEDEIKHAIGKRETKQDPEKVAKEVQAQIDEFLPALFMYTSVAVSELPAKVEERATATKKELDSLKNGDVSKFQELDSKVQNTYDAAKYEINKLVTLAKAAQQNGETLVDNEIAILKKHATETYGELKDKVNQALDNAHKELTRILKVAENGMAQADESARNELNLAEIAYESAKKAFGKTPTHQQFVDAVQKLEDGLTKTVEAVKEKVEEVHAAWEKEDITKIDADIKRTITGSA